MSYEATMRALPLVLILACNGGPGDTADDLLVVGLLDIPVDAFEIGVMALDDTRSYDPQYVDEYDIDWRAARNAVEPDMV